MGIKCRRYNVAILGFGRVAGAFLRHYLNIRKKILQEHNFDLNFIGICDSSSFIVDKNLAIQKLLNQKLKGIRLGYTTPIPLKQLWMALKKEKLDIIIDALPGSRFDAGMSYPLLIEALKMKINLILANKSPLVFKGSEILKIAEEKGCYLGISATVGGAIPTCGIVLNELIGAEIYKVRGVLNGTSNFVLDKIMFESKSKLSAIREAVNLGIAEPDYRFDLEGLDTCYKMIILGLLITKRCMNSNSVRCCGILNMEEKEILTSVRRGKVVRLIGNLSIKNKNPLITVAPEILDKNDPLYGVSGANKGVTFYTKYMGEFTVIGGASGLNSIAATIMKDIINLDRFCQRQK
ncbi:MAG: hypothetical protein ABIL70_00525 [candidate division WOR-3 bacterium]